MTQKNAGHLLVECLVAQGVTHAFGVPGESYLAVLDGFHAHADQISFVTCRQEGGAAFMADAQGRLTGRPGVCFVTRGPGATNASIGVHTAFQDSTPMVLFIGDVASDTRDREAFQEVDFCSFFGPSTKGMAKRVERIDDARRIPEYVARAFRHRHERPPRPGGAGAARGHADADGGHRSPAEGRAGRGLERPGFPAPPARTAAEVRAPVRHRWRRGLDATGRAGAAALCGKLATAGGQCVPVSGHVRQLSPAVRRRRGHRNQPEDWPRGSRPAT